MLSGQRRLDKYAGNARRHAVDAFEWWEWRWGDRPPYRAADLRIQAARTDRITWLLDCAVVTAYRCWSATAEDSMQPSSLWGRALGSAYMFSYTLAFGPGEPHGAGVVEPES